VSSRRISVVILCEDRQTAAFARRFLDAYGWKGLIRVVPFPQDKAAGATFVLREFPNELRGYRSRASHTSQRLIVIVDADKMSQIERLNQLDQECDNERVQRRRGDEKVGIFIPARNIETWIAFLRGELVNEQDEYPKLKRERECGPQARALADTCKKGNTLTDAPDSLRAACDEFRDRVLPASP